MARRLVRGPSAAILLAAAVAVGIGSRAFVVSRAPVFVSDTFQNLLLARSLSAGRGFHSGGAEHPDASRTVLFPATVAALLPLAGDAETAARWVVVLAGAMTVVPLFFLARAMFGPRAALAALPLGAVSCLIAASDRLLATALYVFFVIGAIALAWRARTRPGVLGWLAAGGCAALAALTRPEGIVFPLAIALWAALDPGRRSRPVPKRFGRAVAALAASILVYAPYVVWSSARLGRFSPAPGIAYVQLERVVSDHLALRQVPSPVPWTERARFMLTADHRALYLATTFDTGRFPSPDPASLPPAGVAFAAAPASPEEQTRSVVLRRWYILRSNLRLLPRKAAWDHFITPLVVVLAGVGLCAALPARRGRAAIAFLALMGLTSMAPVASHLEARFFLVPFAVAALLAAAGWGALERRFARAGVPRTLRVVSHALVLFGIAFSGLTHEQPQRDAHERLALLKREAAAVAAELPPGPILAVQPHFPFWADRPYRPIPFATPSAILEYARSQGATSLVVEGSRDLDHRSDLAWLAADDRPAPFRLLRKVSHPNGGDLLVIAIDR